DRAEVLQLLVQGDAPGRPRLRGLLEGVSRGAGERGWDLGHRPEPAGGRGLHRTGGSRCTGRRTAGEPRGGPPPPAPAAGGPGAPREPTCAHLPRWATSDPSVRRRNPGPGAG